MIKRPDPNSALSKKRYARHVRQCQKELLMPLTKREYWSKAHDPYRHDKNGR